MRALGAPFLPADASLHVHPPTPIPKPPHTHTRKQTRVQVLIRRGELVTGVLCKKTLGAAGGGLVHITWMEHGPDTTRRLINNCQARACTGGCCLALPQRSALSLVGMLALCHYAGACTLAEPAAAA